MKFSEDEIIEAVVTLVDEIHHWERESRRYQAGRRLRFKPTEAECAPTGVEANLTRLIEDPVLGALHNAVILLGWRIARGDLRRILEAVVAYDQSDGTLSDDERELNAFLRRNLLEYRWHAPLASVDAELDEDGL
jgi:hypothetical protein